MTTDTEAYAASVIRVLREHFPDTFADPVTAEIIAGHIEMQARSPREWLDVVVDVPCLGKWQLQPREDNPRRVRLVYSWSRRTEADTELERIVNEALRALEVTPDDLT